jgi:hypothetical protein
MYFLAYADSLCEGGIFLPKVGLQELMRCNLPRFLQTGKYCISNLVESAQRKQLMIAHLFQATVGSRTGAYDQL